MASQLAMGNMSPPARGRRCHGGERRSLSSSRGQGCEEHAPPPQRGGPGGRRAQWPEKACGLTRQDRRRVGGGARASARPGDSATAQRWRSERPDGALQEEAGTAVGPDCGRAEGARPARLKGIEPLNECRPKKVSAEADRAQGTYARQRRLTRQGQGQSGRPLVMPLLGLFGGGAGGVPEPPQTGPVRSGPDGGDQAGERPKGALRYDPRPGGARSARGLCAERRLPQKPRPDGRTKGDGSRYVVAVKVCRQVGQVVGQVGVRGVKGDETHNRD